jgi:hypothetical protein
MNIICYITFYKITTLTNYVPRIPSNVTFQDLKSSGARHDIASSFRVLPMLILTSDIKQHAVGLLYNCIRFIPSFVKIDQVVWIYTRDIKSLILSILKSTAGLKLSS